MNSLSSTFALDLQQIFCDTFRLMAPALEFLVRSLEISARFVLAITLYYFVIFPPIGHRHHPAVPQSGPGIILLHPY